MFCNNTVTGKVIAIKRTTSSYYGNPAFFVTIRQSDGTEGKYRTQTDSMIAYAIENPEYRTTSHVFELSKNGRIVKAEIEDYDPPYGDGSSFEPEGALDD